MFVEFRLEDPKVPIKLVHKMTEKQVIKRDGRVHRDSSTSRPSKTLPWQHVIFFEK